MLLTIRRKVRDDLTNQPSPTIAKAVADFDTADVDPDAAALAAEVESETVALDPKPIVEEDIKDLDLKLEDDAPNPATDLKDDAPMPNIWTFDADEAKNEEDKFDKPSFLRRLKRRKKDDDKDDEKADATDTKDKL
jgi:hypothetical protein